ncbi:hypothetical protein PENTCL1PPCAC_4643, partial [Pristionchus entomophagus]
MVVPSTGLFERLIIEALVVSRRLILRVYCADPHSIEGERSEREVVMLSHNPARIERLPIARVAELAAIAILVFGCVAGVHHWHLQQHVLSIHLAFHLPSSARVTRGSLSVIHRGIPLAAGGGGGADEGAYECRGGAEETMDGGGTLVSMVKEG